ncbi:hypothetical protein [uncultured Friedmanniella sp.]|uniref:hypothetical protein n=1 Tax=uncultured Friedmanniella sp. TaxID=335381 RepID=UPI0035CC648E
MARRAAVVMAEDNFEHFENAIRLGVVQEVARAVNATRNRARQIIIRDDAIITGDLWRSITVELTAAGTHGEVYSPLEYASYVHDGTEYMEARPFLTEAIRDITPEAQLRLARILEGVSR